MAEELELVEGFEALDGEADVAEEPTPEVLAELAAVAEAEADAAVAMESELAGARYRVAALRLRWSRGPRATYEQTLSLSAV